MKIEQLIEELRSQRSHIDYTINCLEQALKNVGHRAKAKQIVKEIKPKRQYKKKHWMQLPENRARMLKAVRKMQRGRK